MNRTVAKAAAFAARAMASSVRAENSPSIAKGKPVKLFICAAQSNMGGGGY